MDIIMQKMEEKNYPKALEYALKILDIPEGYQLKNVRSGRQNKNEVWVFRYEKTSGENSGLGGEHFSLTVDKYNYKLLGFTWMDQCFSTVQDLPSKKRTQELSNLFLDKIEPGLFNRLENLWIQSHDEIIVINGKQITVSGMKYKCYLPDGDTYAWVIVGANEKIITFEQEIKWANGRLTEKWLHDSWLKNEIPQTH